MKKEKINFRVKIGVMDLFRFLMHYNYKNAGGVIGIGISVVCLGYLLYSVPHNTNMMNLLLLFMGLLFTVIQPLMLLKKAAVQVVKNPAFQEYLEYEVGEEGITICQKELEQKVLWQDIYKIVENRKQMLIYTSRVNACIWPKEQVGEEKLQQIKADIVEYVDDKLYKGLQQ